MAVIIPLLAVYGGVTAGRAMAAGAAATSNPGTTLCRKEDVFRLYAL